MRCLETTTLANAQKVQAACSALTQVLGLDPLYSRHFVEQPHEESMNSFVAMSRVARDEIDQSGKGTLIIQKLVGSLIQLRVGYEERSRDQDYIRFVILPNRQPT